MSTNPSQSPEQQIEEAQGAYLSFGGWAKEMPNPPHLHERRRFIVDVECTAAGIKSSEKGDRNTRSLSILRVKEITDVVVPPADVDENQGELFPEEDARPDEDDDGKVVNFSDKAK